jgi:hypothetical protein
MLRQLSKKAQEVLLGITDAIAKKPCNGIKIRDSNLSSANFALLCRRHF